MKFNNQIIDFLDPKDRFSAGDFVKLAKKTMREIQNKGKLPIIVGGTGLYIKALMDAIGFHYKYDPATDQFAHASGIMILTPDGRVSRYFYGVEYAPRDVRLGLVEASHSKIGNPVDQILLFCYHYDPATGKYGAAAVNLLRAASAGFVLICGSFHGTSSD